MARLKTARHQRVDAAIRSLANVQAKRMFGADAFFTHGRMFAFLFEAAIVLKLPESDRQDVLDTRVGRPFLTSEHAPFGRWVEASIQGSEAASRAIRLTAAAHALAQMPVNDGPRKRRLVAKRRPARRAVG